MTYPRHTPLIRRGSLSIFTDDNPHTKPILIHFQYNPGELRRTIASRKSPDQTRPNAAPQDARLVAGPPIETINLTLELDAADQLAGPDDNTQARQYGLLVPLAALEMLMYPPKAQFDLNDKLARSGKIQVHPSNLSLVLLNWGKSRVVPVMVTNFSVTEQEFDTQLNPIRAQVGLGLQVLTYIDLRASSKGVDAFVAYQLEKEQLARRYYTNKTPAKTDNLNMDK